MDVLAKKYKHRIYKLLAGREVKNLDRKEKKELKKHLIRYLDRLQRIRGSLSELKKWYRVLKSITGLKDRILIDAYMKFLDSKNAEEVFEK